MNHDFENDLAKCAAGVFAFAIAIFLGAILLLLFAVTVFGQTTNNTYLTNNIPLLSPVVNYTQTFYRVVQTNRTITVGGTTTTNIVPPIIPVTLTASTTTPTGSFWVRAAVTNLSPIVKVTFVVNGVARSPETIAPYCLFGDDGTTCTPGTLPVGTHSIIARVYTNAAIFVSSAPLTIAVGSGVITGAVSSVTITGLPAVATVNFWVTNSTATDFARFVVEASSNTVSFQPISATGTVWAGQALRGQFAEFPITTHAYYRLMLWPEVTPP